MKVAVTGATGHLGGCIIRELHKQNHAIKALIRGEVPDTFEGIPIEWVKGDLENQHALHELMQSCDSLIHAAGLISIQGDPHGLVRKTNVEGTRSVMEAAKAKGIKRVIHISSIHAFEQRPIFETLDEEREKVVRDAFPYDYAKRDGQAIALSYNSPTMEVMVMNPTSFIGPPDDKPSKMGNAIISLCTGKLAFVFSSGFDFCDVRDVAYAIVNGLTMGKEGDSYLLGGSWYSLKEISSLLSAITGKNNKTIVLPLTLGWITLPFIYMWGWIKKEEPLYTHEALVALKKGNRKISSDKAKGELNYKARPLKETLTDTYEWFLKKGYLV